MRITSENNIMTAIKLISTLPTKYPGFDMLNFIKFTFDRSACLRADFFSFLTFPSFATIAKSVLRKKNPFYNFDHFWY